MRLKTLCLCCAGLVLATSLFAAKVKFLADVIVPGVAVDGDLFVDGAPLPISGAASAKGAINTGNGSFRGSLKGEAVNLSGSSHRYKDSPVVEAALEFAFAEDVQTTKYKVGKADGENGVGKCRGSFKGQGI